MAPIKKTLDHMMWYVCCLLDNSGCSGVWVVFNSTWIAANLIQRKMLRNGTTIMQCVRWWWRGWMDDLHHWCRGCSSEDWVLFNSTWIAANLIQRENVEKWYNNNAWDNDEEDDLHHWCRPCRLHDYYKLSRSKWNQAKANWNQGWKFI